MVQQKNTLEEMFISLIKKPKAPQMLPGRTNVK